MEAGWILLVFFLAPVASAFLRELWASVPSRPPSVPQMRRRVARAERQVEAVVRVAQEQTQELLRLAQRRREAGL